jgi:hydroxypyruvate isomerase
MRVKQSICYPLFMPKEMSLKDLCKTAAQIGYKAIELWGRGNDFEQTVETAKSNKLVVASMIGHGSLPDGLNKYENHDRIESELKTSIDLAAKHGIPGVICFSGNRNPGQSDYEGMIACARGLRRIAPYAVEKGVNLNVELLNSKVDHHGYQCDHTDWGLAMVEMVNCPRVKLLFDIYHMQIMEGDVIRNIRKAADKIGHFHTAGNPGRNDMDDTQECNYAGICKGIAGTGYNLYVGHEFKPKGDPIKALHDTFKMCDQG